jgi:hypothetical protein
MKNESTAAINMKKDTNPAAENGSAFSAISAEIVLAASGNQTDFK